MTDAYNASDTRQIRAAHKRSRVERDQDDGVLIALMSSSAGRAWMWRHLSNCNAFRTPFTADRSTTDFRCGEQNIGLRLIDDLLRACPDQFIFMMREANDVERRHDNSGNGHQRSNPDNGRDNSGTGFFTKPDNYDDTDDDGTEADE